MLRLPKTRVAKPTTVAQAVALLVEHGEVAMPIAGGTDLLPNMKHGLFEPEVLVALGGIKELQRFELQTDGTLILGAGVSLDRIAADERVQRTAPALAQAAGLVAGPQLRRMGTLGGNVMLDTRCQWYNQTHFWRQALGYCLKKDGTVCHVVAGGKKCVAAASNDTAPTLMTLQATLVFEGRSGRREVAIDDLWHTDGIHNKKLGTDEILVEVRVPPRATGHRGAYGKLRERGSIDYPMLGVAARLDVGRDGAVEGADLVLVALQARPVRVRRAAELLIGVPSSGDNFAEAVAAVAEAAYAQAHPMPNIPGDHEWRREMVPVYVARTLHAAATGTGPVHHV
ncbi:MAG: 4-hydroxybenzoyl-CoA reductase subunit beta [Planctomycetaceae bacterium]|nr:4-hydroxybenzoyl-CoA reductase subunit beta [Planctomycetaceae bacterium]